MERPVLDSQLISTRNRSVCFELATESDDAEIRRLLRENPMLGQVTVSLEREPNFFADADLPGETKQTIVAREKERIVCVGSCATRKRFVSGKQHRTGYLAGLRLDESFAGRFDILRRGYEFFRELQRDDPADFYFTSIAADNRRARRFLERGLPAMPSYQFAGEFVTLLFPVLKRGLKKRLLCPTDVAPLDEMCAFLNEQSRRYALAPCWSVDELTALSHLGLSANDFHVVRREGRIVACSALWDQRAFKQTVVRGYTAWLSSFRPLVNLASALAGRPRLPEPGATVSHAFISHLAVASDQPGALVELIQALSDIAKGRNIDLLTVGFAANDPRLHTLRSPLRCREYRSRVYLVYWPESLGSVPDLTNACLAPEVALL